MAFRKIGAALVTIAALSGLLVACGSSSKKTTGADTGSQTTGSSTPVASGAVRGFDGSTITLAELGVKAQLGGGETGVQARIERFNDTNEIPGIKLKFAEYADDKQDPATALSEARRLVSEDKAFAIVGDLSANNPGDYFKQQHVPYFGYAFDNTYCSHEATTSTWGFGFSGCLVPNDPSEMPDSFFLLYDYVKKQTGKAAPTVALYSSDIQSGRNTAKFQAVELKGVGFNVVMAKPILPPPPVTDYSPYVQQVLASDNGHAPDVIACYAVIDCIPMYKQFMAQGFKGVFYHTLWSDALINAFKGAYVGVSWANPNDPNANMDKIKADIKAYKADASVEIGSLAGYFSTDMFITALKAVAKKGTKNITPEAVRDYASTMTYGIDGVVGPTKYPRATVVSPSCTSFMVDDGTQWKTVTPFTCSSKTYKP